MKKLFFRSPILCPVLIAGISFAQEPAAMPEPTKEHFWLATFTGEWITFESSTATRVK